MKNLSKLILAIALLAGIVAVAGKCFAWNISGTVYAGDRATGMLGAVLELTDSANATITTINSDASGNFIFSDLANGDYRIYFSHPRYELFSLNTTQYERTRNKFYVPVKVQESNVNKIDFYRACDIKGLVDISADPPQDIGTIINTEEGKLVRFKIWIHDADFFYYYEPITPLPSGAVLDKDVGEFMWVPTYDTTPQGETISKALTFRVKEYDYKNGGEIINEYPWEDTITVSINVADKSGPFTIIPEKTNGPAPFRVMFHMENVPDNAAAEAVKPFHLWWDFGDDGIAHWVDPGHIYSKPGTYTVKLKVVNDNFNIIPGAEAQAVITVNPEPAPDPAKTYYIAPDGNDANPGTIDKPWSIYALKKWHYEGERIFLRGGVYNIPEIRVYIGRCYGTAENPIWVSAYPGERPIINGTIGLSYSRHLIMDGLHIISPSAPWACSSVVPEGATIMVLGDIKEVTIRNNILENACLWVHGSDNTWLLVENNQFLKTGPHFKGNYGIIRNNYIDGGADSKAAPRGIKVYGNYMYSFYAGGQQNYGGTTERIFLGQMADSIIYNNVVVADSAGSGWSNGGFGKSCFFHDSFRIGVINNTFVSRNTTLPEPGIGGNGASLIYLYSMRRGDDELNVRGYTSLTMNRDCKYTLLLNNIFHVPKNAYFYNVPSFNQVGFISNNNIFFEEPAHNNSVLWGGASYSIDGYKNISGQDANSYSLDPAFLDYAHRDFHLSFLSPAIDNGFKLPFDRFLDFDKVLRGQSYDIGAYEYAPGLITYNISGSIVDKFDNPVPDIGITLTGQRNMFTETLSDGTYQFGSCVPGNYIIKPCPMNASFIPESLSVDVTNVDLNNKNFILNRPPILEPIGVKAVGLGQTLTFIVNATDPDLDSLTYFAENLPTGATFTNQIFSWMPTQEGTYEVTFKVVDSSNFTVHEKVKIIVLSAFVAGNGDGLIGQYFSNKDLLGEPAFTRVDTTVDFYWANGQSPGPLIPSADYFSIRWTGQILAPTDGTYTFSIYHDDGVRLWIDNQKLIDNWQNQGDRTDTATINLTAGAKYPITLEYYEATYTANVHLSWGNPATAGEKAIIPHEYLYSSGQVPALAGDFDGDGVVGIKDLILVAKDYGIKYNISHIILVAKNYGRTL